MAEKTLKTRIALKIDTLANWQSTALGDGKGANYVLKHGEIGLVEIPNTIPPVPGTEPSGKTEVMFKVGDGSTKFSALPWASAMAADVYAWAKKPNPDYNDLINAPSITVSPDKATGDHLEVDEVIVLSDISASGHTITQTGVKVPTKQYVDNKVAGSVQYLGVAKTLSELSTTAGKGDFYRANFDDSGVNKGDLLIAAKDNPTASIDDTDGYSIVKSSDDYVGTVKWVKAGKGITVDKASAGEDEYTVSHANTSDQGSVNNSGRTYIQDVTLDEFGHVTKLTSATETVVDTNTWRNVKVNGDEKLTTDIKTGAIEFVNGSNTAVEFTADNKIKINATDTVYTHPEGNAASKELDFYKFSTDAKSHIASVEKVGKNDIITVLGYTPYNATNPDGYTTNKGTVTSVTGGTGLSGTITTSGNISLKQSTNAEIGGGKATPTNAAMPSGKNYEVKIDNTGKYFVAVPWENTTYTVNNGKFTVTAGNGLTEAGEGYGTANQAGNTTATLAVGAGTGITVGTDDVAVTDYNNILTAEGDTLKTEGGNTIIFDCGGATN